MLVLAFVFVSATVELFGDLIRGLWRFRGVVVGFVSLNVGKVPSTALGFGVGSIDQPTRIVLSRTRPSSAALARFGRALAEADSDDDLRQQLRRTRADLFGRRSGTAIPWVVRPWVTHTLTDLAIVSMVLALIRR